MLSREFIQSEGRTYQQEIKDLEEQVKFFTNKSQRAEKENKQLQEQLNVLKSNYDGIYNFITELNKLCELDEDTLEEDLYSYIKQLRGRIDKAIELMEKCKFDKTDKYIAISEYKEYQQLLSILQDKERDD